MSSPKICLLSAVWVPVQNSFIFSIFLRTLPTSHGSVCDLCRGGCGMNLPPSLQRNSMWSGFHSFLNWGPRWGQVKLRYSLPQSHHQTSFIRSETGSLFYSWLCSLYCFFSKVPSFIVSFLVRKPSVPIMVGFYTWF